LKRTLADALSDADEAEELRKVLVGSKKELEQSKKGVHKLKSQKLRSNSSDRVIIKRLKMPKPIKPPEMCSLALFLVKAGCSRDYVGEVIEHVFNTAGILVKSIMRRQTVFQCIIEGEIAPQI
jgi:hypothetical protein